RRGTLRRPLGRRFLLRSGQSAVAWGCIIFGFSLEEGLILQTIIPGETAHQRMARPIMEDPTDIFARDARHCGEAILGDFVLNNDASLSNVTNQTLRQDSTERAQRVP